jgi:hypothetical protein
MPNGKTHFLAGVAVGATVNFIIQSAKMAADYDRKFDWGELFLCAGAGAFAANPKGIASFSPGLRGTSYPGIAASNVHNPERVAPGARGSIIHEKSSFLGGSEVPDLPHGRPFCHGLISAGLVAYAISGQHTSKFSRATRLFLWAFTMSYFSHMARDPAANFASRLTFNPLPSLTFSNLR